MIGSRCLDIGHMLGRWPGGLAEGQGCSFGPPQVQQREKPNQSEIFNYDTVAVSSRDAEYASVPSGLFHRRKQPAT